MLLLGAFFINAIGMDNFLFATLLTDKPELVDTLDKLKATYMPIFRHNIEMNHSSTKNIRFQLNSVLNRHIVFKNKTWKYSHFTFDKCSYDKLSLFFFIRLC